MCMHIHTCAFVHTLNARVGVCTSAMHLFRFVCMYCDVCIHVCMHACMHACMCVCSMRVRGDVMCACMCACTCQSVCNVCMHEFRVRAMWCMYVQCMYACMYVMYVCGVCNAM